jgi:low temperature requirement protein LtrA
MTARRPPPQPACLGQTGVMTEPDSSSAAHIGGPAGDPPEAAPAAVPEKRVTWAELFFDLVFVFAVTEVSALLGHEQSGAGLLRALIVFVPCYWLWVGTSIRVNQDDINRPWLRIEVFAIALAAIFMALAIPRAYSGLGLLFALAYWAGRMVLGAGMLREAARTGSIPVNPVSLSMAVTGPLLVIGALLPDGAREAVWAVAAALDLSSPTLLRARLALMHYDAAHLAERFGAFVLIALGESVVAIGAGAASGHRLSLAAGLAVAAAFTLACGLAWVYFHFAADAMRFSLATARVQTDITRLVLSYGHLLFITAIIMAAVGMREAVAHPGDSLGWPGAGLLAGGVALYLASFGFTRWAMFRLISWTRLIAAAGVLVLLPAAAYLPALAGLAVLAIGVAVLNVVEFDRVAHIGWRALLARREQPGPGSGTQ